MMTGNGNLPQQQQQAQRRNPMVQDDVEQVNSSGEGQNGSLPHRSQSAPPPERYRVRLDRNDRLAIPQPTPSMAGYGSFVIEGARVSECSDESSTQRFSVPPMPPMPPMLPMPLMLSGNFGNFEIVNRRVVMGQQARRLRNILLRGSSAQAGVRANELLASPAQPEHPENQRPHAPLPIIQLDPVDDDGGFDDSDEEEFPSPTDEDRFEHLFEIENHAIHQKLSDMVLKDTSQRDESLTTLTLLITTPDSVSNPVLDESAPSNENLCEIPSQSNSSEFGKSHPSDVEVGEPITTKKNIPLSLLRRLVLVFGIQVHAAQYRVEIPRLDGVVVQRIKNNFPNLKKLEIVDHDLANIIDHVCNFLEHYEGQLAHLKILTVSAGTEDPVHLIPPWKRLEQALNAYGSNLRHLTIFDLRRPGPLMAELSLENLQELYYSFYVKNDLREFFAHIDKFPALKGFGCLTSINTAVDDVPCPCVYRRVFQVVDLRRLIYPDFGPQVGMVNQLEILAIRGLLTKVRNHNLSKCTDEFISSDQFHTLLTALAKIPELKELRIPYCADMFDGWFKDRMFFPLELKKIKYLTLDCAICPHEDVQFIGQLFPNLISLRVFGYYKDCMLRDGVYELPRNQNFCRVADRELKSCCQHLIGAIYYHGVLHFQSIEKLKMYRYPNLVEDPEERADMLERCDGLVVVKMEYSSKTGNLDGVQIPPRSLD